MIELRPLEPHELGQFLDTAIPRYATELVRSGNVETERAPEIARDQFDELLPDGLSTPDQYLFVLCVRPTGEPVGTLWIGVRRDRSRPFAALYDLYVEPAFRRRGYATQALAALETKVRDLGLDVIRLHVFGHNRPARELYAKLGYAETDVTMAKSVG